MKFPGENSITSASDMSDSVLADQGKRPHPSRLRKCPKKPSPEQWREFKLSGEEYDVFNASCSWKALLTPFDAVSDIKDESCGNCFKCQPNRVRLATLSHDEVEGTELEHMVKIVHNALEKLADELGQLENNPFMRRLSPVARERVLNAQERKSLSRSYLQLQRGTY